MAKEDWAISSLNTTQTMILHADVPDQQLSHDTWAVSVSKTGSSGPHRMRFLYAPTAIDYANFTLDKDVSVRGAFNLRCVDAGIKCVLGVRCDSNPMPLVWHGATISENGYQLIIEDTAPGWIARLERYNGGVCTYLNDVLLATGPGYQQNRWFHLRLDFLLHLNGDATIRVFKNDLIANPIQPGTSPEWGSVWEKIIEVSDLAINVPQHKEIGWGVDEINDIEYTVYADWLDLRYSP